MNQLLRNGDKVAIRGGSAECRVGDFLGGGGQGEVYRATWQGKEYALKWYYLQWATDEQFASLETLLRIGFPDERFLWPQQLSTRVAGKGYGYLMDLRGAKYKGINDLMKRRADPTFRSLTTAGFQLADSFLNLHAKGLCYRDISFGNVFLDPNTGDILICDNDNVGVNRESSSGVMGTQRFMAPEIVTGKDNPSSDSDLYSLAVLLFYIFYLHHPLDGALEAAIHVLDIPAMNRLYGQSPVYIFDPVNLSNRPVPGLHDNAIIYREIYPAFLNELFEKTFTKGIRDIQHGRTRESEWRSAMLRLRDLLCFCPDCRAENYYDPQSQATGTQQHCWNCQHPIRFPLKLSIGRKMIMLNHNTQLFPYHIDRSVKPNCAFDFSVPVGEVTRHPTQPNVWGLKNLSGDNWKIKLHDGQEREVPPGKNAPLAAGHEISFGSNVVGIVVS
jgi:serine/threonine protein kinase